MKSSSAANDNLIDQTIELWQPRLRHELSREDARQIVENVTGFFSILAEWSKTATPAKDISDQADRNGNSEISNQGFKAKGRAG